MDSLCESLFKKPSVIFMPRRGDALESKLGELISDLGVTLPIIHIKKTLYLVGTQRVNMTLKGGNQVLVLIGGGS